MANALPQANSGVYRCTKFNKKVVVFLVSKLEEQVQVTCL